MRILNFAVGTLRITFYLYLLQAEEYIDRFEYEMAQKFCQRALEMEPDNVRALETSGSLLIDLGNLDAAKQVCFLHCLR